MQVNRRILYTPVLTTGVPVVTTTWNPLDHHTNVTLSNGNLTATVNAATGGNYFIRDTVSHSSGKYYSEHNIDLAAANFGIGVANSSESNLPGVFDNNSAGLNQSGDIWVNGVNTPTLAAAATGNTIDMAVDIDNKTFWFRLNGGNWNASGTANPATNTGGVSWSATAAGPYFAYLNLASQLNDAQTVNFGGTAFLRTVPSGFGSW